MPSVSPLLIVSPCRQAKEESKRTCILILGAIDHLLDAVRLNRQSAVPQKVPEALYHLLVLPGYAGLLLLQNFVEESVRSGAKVSGGVALGVWAAFCFRKQAIEPSYNQVSL
jgi:hypothetical protein